MILHEIAESLIIRLSKSARGTLFTRPNESIILHLDCGYTTHKESSNSNTVSQQLVENKRRNKEDHNKSYREGTKDRRRTHPVGHPASQRRANYARDVRQSAGVEKLLPDFLIWITRLFGYFRTVCKTMGFSPTLALFTISKSKS